MLYPVEFNVKITAEMSSVLFDVHYRLKIINIFAGLVFSFLYSVTVYPKKYAHGFCFAVLCCGHTLTDFPISIRLTSLALWQSNDCPSASKATLMNIDKYFMWIHYERLHNHNKAKHNKTVCIFLGIYCSSVSCMMIKSVSFMISSADFSLRWHHNERDGVSNHQPHHCLLNRLFRHRSKKTSKLRVTGLFVWGIHRWIPRTNGQLRGKFFH